jgi:hypothetical protein
MIVKKVTTVGKYKITEHIKFIPRKTTWYLFGMPVFTSIIEHRESES